MGKMGLFLTWGYPNSLMIYFMENPSKRDDSGYPYFRKPPNGIVLLARMGKLNNNNNNNNSSNNNNTNNNNKRKMMC
jgi:hypothetical protein